MSFPQREYHYGVEGKPRCRFFDLPRSRSSALPMLLALAAFLLAIPALAADYPARPVRFIIPFPPGGGTDILGRTLAQKLGEALGQQFVVDNRGGAASLLGAELAAKSAPDGYTLLLASGSFAISAGFYKSLPYDPVRDFDAVGMVATQPLVFVVHPSFPASSIRELVAYAKANPDKVNYASGGDGGINHLAAELFKKMTGTRMVHIPYKGAGPALTALLGGEVQLFIATLGSVLSHVRSSKLRALAIASVRRSPTAPDLPTVAEAGVPGYEATNWYGVLAPRGTPPAVISALNREVEAALKDKSVGERLTAQGFESATSTPRQFADYLKSEIVKWARTIKDAGINQSR
ncbi:MAG TPA: tripartite tricarboxylate transporter substrate binding protein [Burkholderiales bacterium]|nr:tripartite tricarboxylate transporter substrate binding protein [Burkholderiales bacterium]